MTNPADPAAAEPAAQAAVDPAGGAGGDEGTASAVAGDLGRLDDALVRLRRLWSSPRQVIDHDGRPVEMSSVLVVEACARGAVRGAEVGVGDVALFADVTPSTASRLVERAVRADLVRRNPSARDARRTVLQLTAAGRALQSRALNARLGWLGSVVDGWPADDLAALVGLLGRFADRITQTGTPGHGSTDADTRT